MDSITEECMRKTREKERDLHPRRVRVTLVHENQTESMRLLRFSGLQGILKSIKRASVSESSNGETGKAPRV